MKKTINNTIAFLLLIVSYTSFGQNNMEDVVYLKNGSIIRGIIIEQIPNQSIKIQTKDRNIFVFKIEEIEKITKEEIPNQKLSNTDFKKKGYINITEIAYCAGIGSVSVNRQDIKNIDQSWGFRSVNGIQFNEHTSLGIGFGIDAYKSATLLPITIDTRVAFIKGQISPVFTLNAGWAFGLNNAPSGFVFNPQFGIKTYISKNVAYLFNVGWKGQNSEVEYLAYNYDSYGNMVYPYYVTKTSKVNFQFISISTGFAF